MREKVIVFTDGGSRGNPGIAGAGVFVTNEAGEEIYRDYKFLGTKTNNEAEYLAMNLALKYLKRTITPLTEIVFKLDSKLVVEQMNKKWQIKEDRLRVLAQMNWEILKVLPCSSCKITYVPRAENKMADLLANQAMDAAKSEVLG